MKQLKLIKYIWQHTWWGKYALYFLLINAALPSKRRSYKSSTDWMRYGSFYREVAVSVLLLLAVFFVWRWWKSRKVQAQQQALPDEHALPDVLAGIMTGLFVAYSVFVSYFHHAS